jgi:hypothetical protein
MPWPTGSQHLLVTALTAAPEHFVDNFHQWRASLESTESFEAGTYRLLPLLYYRSRNAFVSDPLIGELQTIYRKAWVETTTVLRCTAPVVAALSAAGIRTMVIKGAPLALEYYPSIATRPMLDLDVMIDRDQVAAAMTLLKQDNWVMGTTTKPHEQPDTHAIDVLDSAGNAIDIHWHFLREIPSSDADQWFWDSARSFDFCGVETLRPGAEALLLHTIVHGVRSNLEPPIRWITDAAAILAKEPGLDWDDMARFAERYKLTYRLGLGLGLLAETYHQDIPKVVIQRLLKQKSIVERIENSVYLKDPRNQFKPLVYPLVDYWRFARCRSGWTLLQEFPTYIKRRWQISSMLQVPGLILRSMFRRFRAS